MSRTIVIIDTPAGKYLAGAASTVEREWREYPRVELRILNGTSMFVESKQSGDLLTKIEQRVILTYDTSYIGYLYPGMYTHRDEAPIYLLDPVIINTATEPIPLEAFRKEQVAVPLVRYENTTIYVPN